MKTNWLLLFLPTLLINAPTYGQAPELSKEEFKEMSAFAYEMCRSIFADKNYVYKEAPFEKEDFFDPVSSAQEVDDLIELMKKDGQLSVEDEGFGPQLVFSISFGPELAEAVNSIESVNVQDVTLKDEKGKALQLENYFQNSQTNDEYKFKVGIEKNTYPASANLNGDATYLFQFLVGYDQIKLSEKNIGETFSLNDCSFKLADIHNNQLILETLCDERPSVKLINLVDDERVFEAYSYEELMEMKEKDETINTDGLFTQSSQTIDKKFYTFFKKDPDLSLKKFRALLSKKEIARLSREEDIYLILEHVAPIGDQFILFAPKFRTEEIVFSY